MIPKWTQKTMVNEWKLSFDFQTGTTFKRSLIKQRLIAVFVVQIGKSRDENEIFRNGMVKIIFNHQIELLAMLKLAVYDAVAFLQSLQITKKVNLLYKYEF